MFNLINFDLILCTLFSLQHDLDVNSSQIPVAIRCSVERLQDSGVYLLGKYPLRSLFVWGVRFYFSILFTQEEFHK